MKKLIAALFIMSSISAIAGNKENCGQVINIYNEIENGETVLMIQIKRADTSEVISRVNESIRQEATSLGLTSMQNKKLRFCGTSDDWTTNLVSIRNF